MTQGFGQHLGVSQRQQLTPYQQQGLRLLLLSNVELAAALAEEAAANPLIDIVGPRHASLSPAEGTPAAPREAAPLLTPGSAPGRGEGPDISQFAARRETLIEHIETQISLAGLSAPRALIANTLLAELDGDGWLRVDLEAIAGQLGAPLQDVEKTLATLQSFSPAGVFCRTLKECLSLQLAERDRLDPWMAALLDHLDLVAERDITALSALAGAAENDVEDMLVEIRSLNPHPGAVFGDADPVVIVPDIIVRSVGGGTWTVDANVSSLPRVIIREGQFERLSTAARCVSDKRWIDARINSARRLREILERRGQTILDVAVEIVKHQQRFFEEGARGLRPLMLKTIAEKLDMHESTVSRVVANKYMQTPRGIFSFKTFFVQAAPGGADAGVTVDDIKRRIVDLVAAESRRGAAYSDQALTELLNRAGARLARRTVAKYREELGIPNSTARRKLAS